MKKLLFSLLLVLGIYSYSFAEVTAIDGVGVYYGEPKQFAWVVFNPGVLPNKEIVTSQLKEIVCQTIAEDMTQLLHKVEAVKYPLLVKVTQWEKAGTGFQSIERYTYEITNCNYPILPKKQPKMKGEREA